MSCSCKYPACRLSCTNKTTQVITIRRCVLSWLKHTRGTLDLSGICTDTFNLFTFNWNVFFLGGRLGLLGSFSPISVVPFRSFPRIRRQRDVILTSLRRQHFDRLNNWLNRESIVRSRPCLGCLLVACQASHRCSRWSSSLRNYGKGSFMGLFTARSAKQDTHTRTR